MELFLILSGLTIIFFAISLRHIPADPPHIAVVTLLGQRLRQVKREGYRLFPFYPVIYNAVLINMTKKNQYLPPLIVRTRDLAELEISVSLTWTPNEDYAIEYLNHGSEDGIKNILSDMVKERLRERAIGADKGPRNWEELLHAQDEATAMLIREIVGLPSHLSKGEHDELIQKIRAGNGIQPIPQMGITLNRLNITEIKPRGELAQAAERFVKEQQDMKGVTYVLGQADEIMKKVGCSYTQAIELLQTERGKVAKKIQEIKGSVSDDIMKAVVQIIETFQKKKE